MWKGVCSWLCRSAINPLLCIRCMFVCKPTLTTLKIYRQRPHKDSHSLLFNVLVWLVPSFVTWSPAPALVLHHTILLLHFKSLFVLYIFSMIKLICYWYGNSTYFLSLLKKAIFSFPFYFLLFLRTNWFFFIYNYFRASTVYTTVL